MPSNWHWFEYPAPCLRFRFCLRMASPTLEGLRVRSGRAPLGMKDRYLWKLSVQTTAEAEEAVVELLQSLSSQAATSYTDLESGKVSVSIYLKQPPAGLR